MPSITINSGTFEFEPGQTILQVANANGVEIPQYCYHDGLSIVANCRICLAEVWAPNPRNENKLEPVAGGKLLPTCQTPASDGMVVRSDSPKSVANQKAVMEYLLLNHPLDCPICDQAGECWLQDYSYRYGRGVSRFQEQKVKNPKKDVGPHVWLYADRCILCTRCVRFTREITETNELIVQGRGNTEEIDVFPGQALDNDLSGNVIDLCPVGALLDKDFLFTQRVWFLRSSPSIDGITASGDNIKIEHNEGRIYRVLPRTNLEINKHWITDEVRYGWKFVHSDDRLANPRRTEHGVQVPSDFEQAYLDMLDLLRDRVTGHSDEHRPNARLAMMVSPMLTCEEAYLLAALARAIDPDAALAVGPVPVHGHDKVFPPSMDRDDPRAFIKYAEKAPNARGVRRVLRAVLGQTPLEFDALLDRLGRGTGTSDVAAVILTGNYPSRWATPELAQSLGGKATVLIDTLAGDLADDADIVLPGATWAEKAGTFENARGMLQAFEQAIPTVGGARSEGQIALDLLARLGEVEPDTEQLDVYEYVDEQPGVVPTAREIHLGRTRLFNAAAIRAEMAERVPALDVFLTDLRIPESESAQSPDMEMVEL